MKIFRIFLVFLVTGALIVACSKESKEEMSSVVNESATVATISANIPLDASLQKLEATLLNFDQTEEFRAQSITASSRNALPARVLNTVANNYPNATIQSYEVYTSVPGASYQHYSVLLDNGIEFVVFQWGHILARATIEAVYEPNELKAGQLPWNLLLRIYSNYQNDLIEEIEPRGSSFEVDLKDGRELIINASGTVIAINQDADGDDDDDDSGNTLPGVDGIDNNSSSDDDDDGLGDNDDGVSGNNDDDDDGNGDNDDGISSNNDDDDDGDGDNDDGISSNSDDDDDGDGDNDDGVSSNSDDDDDGDGDNDDGVSSNSDDDDDGNGDDDDGVAGNGNHIDPATLPTAIRNYIAANYPGATITEAERYSNQYEVELNNGVELYFDLNGNLISSSGSSSDDDDDNGTSDNDDDDDNGTSDNDDDDN